MGSLPKSVQNGLSIISAGIEAVQADRLIEMLDGAVERQAVPSGESPSISHVIADALPDERPVHQTAALVGAR